MYSTVPCVYGIRIGETPLDQVIPILEQNGLSECQKEESASWIGIICGYSVVVQVDKATSIVNVTGFYPSVPISLGEIIEKYGEPDFALLQTEGSAEAPTRRMGLFWDELKMAVEMPRIDNHIYNLDRTTTAEMVIFWMKRNIAIPMRYRSESITSRGMGTAPISHDLIS